MPSERRKATTVSCRFHGFFGQFAKAILGEKNSAVGSGIDVPGSEKPRQGAIDCDMGHAQTPRQVRHPRFTEDCRKIGNGLDIVLR